MTCLKEARHVHGPPCLVTMCRAEHSHPMTRNQAKKDEWSNQASEQGDLTSQTQPLGITQDSSVGLCICRVCHSLAGMLFLPLGFGAHGAVFGTGWLWDRGSWQCQLCRQAGS